MPARPALLRRLLPVMLALLVGSTRADEAGGGASRGFFGIWDPRTSPFIPIPEVGTDPNSGTTVGLIPTFLITDADRKIREMIAPDLAYNPNAGFGAHFRTFAYPSADTQWYLVAGAKERIDRELDAVYTDGITRQSAWSWSARLRYDRNGSQRFYGLGNDTSEHADTNHTKDATYIEAKIGYNFTPHWQLAIDLRPRFIEIQRGLLDDEPDTAKVFRGLPGMRRAHEFLTRTMLSYDTRDSVSLPRQGSQLLIFAGLADRRFLSSTSYSLVGFEFQHYRPFGDRLTLAVHAMARYMPGADEVPFWALGSLGGDRSLTGERAPLRGYGDDRFIDRHMVGGTLELRDPVFGLDLFATHITLEIAPFVDLGRVFRQIDANPFDHVHYAGGIGFRGIAAPYVVGYVDIGYGSEGTAVFSGINYPF